MHEDYFRKQGPRQAVMRQLLEREAALRAKRLGLERRTFLGGALGALAAFSIAEQTGSFLSRAEAQDGFEPPSEDCYAMLRDEHGVGLDGALDWRKIEHAARVQQTATPDTILSMLRALDSLYGGFCVSQLTHATQTATRAVRANASDELVLLALIHDVGESLVSINHGEIAGALVRPHVSDGGYRAVRHHLEFQVKHYGDVVGVATDMRERYASEPWYPEAVKLTDDFDQLAFDPDYPSLPLEEFEPLIRTTFSRLPTRVAERDAVCP